MVPDLEPILREILATLQRIEKQGERAVFVFDDDYDEIPDHVI